MGRRTRSAAAAVIVVATGACSPFTSTPANPDAATTSDANGGDSGDAGKVTTPCTTKINDEASLLSTRWKPVGNTIPYVAYAQLTTGTAQVGGAIVWPDPMPLDNIDVTFDVSITGDESQSGIGHGVVFFALDVPAPGPLPKLTCNAGSYYCVLDNGIPGYAVVVRTAPEAGEPKGAYLAVVDAADTYPPRPDAYVLLDKSKLTTDVSPLDESNAPADDTWRTIRIRVRAGVVVAVDIGGVPTLKSIPIAPSASSFGYIGISAATGGSTNRSRHAVRRVSVASGECGG